MSNFFILIQLVLVVGYAFKIDLEDLKNIIEEQEKKEIQEEKPPTSTIQPFWKTRRNASSTWPDIEEGEKFKRFMVEMISDQTLIADVKNCLS
jgi:hypothetical protein